MPKIDKSLLTKEEFRRLKEQQRIEKARKKLLNESANSIKQNRPVNSKTSFVLGNGTSRRSVNPNELRQHGKIYACNAIYREFVPDYLVAVDPKMIYEIKDSKYQLEHEVWTNYNKRYEGFEGFNYFQPSKGWSSGPTALWLASQHQPEEIYILGFDYLGLNDGKKFNNVYADTKNYKKSSENATFYGNWLRQTEQVIRDNQKIRYIRVILPDNFQPKQLNNFTNYHTITLNDFKKIFGIF